MEYVFSIFVGYFLGCIPSGLFVGRYFGNIDIRNYGSKNIGTTNVFRTLGLKPALVVLVLDMGKGIVAVIFAQYFSGENSVLLLGGIAAMLGHNYPVFLHFKGGRGVATGLGVILFLMPKVTVLVFTVWSVIVFLTKYVSLASVVAAFFVPVLAWYFEYPSSFCFFSILAAAFVIIRHKENIVRLLHGNESKIKAGSIVKSD
jgi:glycerol-3-phosphate acyltransferase PlsY